MLKTRLPLLLAVLLPAGLLLMSFTAPAAPPLDAGGFPTLTPTITSTPLPSLTPTNTQQVIIVTLGSGYPLATATIEGLDPGYPSNIQEEDLLATQIAQESAQEEQPAGRNPLITVAYIGLFILLVVGVWMLFSRRGMRP